MDEHQYIHVKIVYFDTDIFSMKSNIIKPVFFNSIIVPKTKGLHLIIMSNIKLRKLSKFTIYSHPKKQ